MVLLRGQGSGLMEQCASSQCAPDPLGHLPTQQCDVLGLNVWTQGLSYTALPRCRVQVGTDACSHCESGREGIGGRKEVRHRPHCKSGLNIAYTVARNAQRRLTRTPNRRLAQNLLDTIKSDFQRTYPHLAASPPPAAGLSPRVASLATPPGMHSPRRTRHCFCRIGAASSQQQTRGAHAALLAVLPCVPTLARKLATGESCRPPRIIARVPACMFAAILPAPLPTRTAVNRCRIRRSTARVLSASSSASLCITAGAACSADAWRIPVWCAIRNAAMTRLAASRCGASNLAHEMQCSLHFIVLSRHHIASICTSPFVAGRSHAMTEQTLRPSQAPNYRPLYLRCPAARGIRPAAARWARRVPSTLRSAAGTLHGATVWAAAPGFRPVRRRSARRRLRSSPTSAAGDCRRTRRRCPCSNALRRPALWCPRPAAAVWGAPVRAPRSRTAARPAAAAVRVCSAAVWAAGPVPAARAVPAASAASWTGSATGAGAGGAGRCAAGRLAGGAAAERVAGAGPAAAAAAVPGVQGGCAGGCPAGGRLGGRAINLSSVTQKLAVLYEQGLTPSSCAHAPGHSPSLLVVLAWQVSLGRQHAD